MSGIQPQRVVVSRQEAIDGGLPRYFTGEACKRGHVAERRTIGGDCVECDAVRRQELRDRLEQAKAARVAEVGAGS